MDPDEMLELANERYEALMEECGLGDDGQCSLAGSEHCDFSCPWRDSEDFAGSEAWKAIHTTKEEQET